MTFWGEITSGSKGSACPTERRRSRVWVLLWSAERRLPQPSPVGQSLQRHYSHTDHFNDHIGHNEVTRRCERGKGGGIRNIGLRPTLIGRSKVMSTRTGDLE